MKIWMNGGIVPLEEAKISVLDHGLLYGDGIFEGIRIYGAKVFRLSDHLHRFATAAKAIGLTLPGGLDAVRQIVLETARSYGQSEAYLRLVLTRGEGELGVDPTTCSAPRLFCIVDQVRIHPAEKLASGLDLLTSSLRRPAADALDPRVKSLNYLNNVLAKVEARQRGADEALLLGATGLVAEAAVANIFAWLEGELVTPPATDGALEGITRRTVLELAGDLGLPAREKSLGRFDLLSAAEVFLTGSGAGLVPVRSLDARVIGAGEPGPVFAKLRAAFLDAAPSLGVPVL